MGRNRNRRARRKKSHGKRTPATLALEAEDLDSTDVNSNGNNNSNCSNNNKNNNKNDDEEESYDFPDDPNNDKCQVLNENGEDVTSKFYDYHHRLVNCTGELVCHAFTTTNCPSILCKENQACYEAKFFNVTSNVECLGKKPCRHAEIHALALAAVSTTTSDNGNNENDEDKEDLTVQDHFCSMF